MLPRLMSAPSQVHISLGESASEPWQLRRSALNSLGANQRHQSLELATRLRRRLISDRGTMALRKPRVFVSDQLAQTSSKSQVRTGSKPSTQFPRIPSSDPTITGRHQR